MKYMKFGCHCMFILTSFAWKTFLQNTCKCTFNGLQNGFNISLYQICHQWKMFFEIICNTYFLKFLFCWTFFPEFRSGVGLVRGQPSDSVKKLFFFCFKVFLTILWNKKMLGSEIMQWYCKVYRPPPPAHPYPQSLQIYFCSGSFS